MMLLYSGYRGLQDTVKIEATLIYVCYCADIETAREVLICLTNPSQRQTVHWPMMKASLDRCDVVAQPHQRNADGLRKR